MTNDSSDEIAAALSHNLTDVMENGPGLRLGRSVWVAARDDANGFVMLSGLGGMGVGTMWFPADERHHEYIGWDDAPIVDTVAGEDITYAGLTIRGDREIPDVDQRRAAWSRTPIGFPD